MNYEINNIETLEQLIEKHKKSSIKVKKYEFDSTSYTLLLIEINKKLKENQKLKEQLQRKEDIINKAKKFTKGHIFQFGGDKDFDALLEILKENK